MYIPAKIKNIIGDRRYTIDSIGMSDSQVICFDDMVLKIEKQGENSDNELRMMTWLANKLPVPKIICSERANGINYLLMNKIKGQILCSDEILSNPKYLIKLLVEGLNMLWSVDISDCPYSNSIDNKLKLAEVRVCNNLCDMENVEPNTYEKNGFKNPAHLLQWLKDNKPTYEPVFSHGDYCLPNILCNNNTINGFIDLGNSGISDKYQDIALGYRSLLHNYNGKFGKKIYDNRDILNFFDELNITPNWEKVKYFMLLDELF